MDVFEILQHVIHVETEACHIVKDAQMKLVD